MDEDGELERRMEQGEASGGRDRVRAAFGKDPARPESVEPRAFLGQ